MQRNFDHHQPFLVNAQLNRYNSLLMKALDFFCGAGGLTRGLLDAGIEVLAGIDIDDRLQETYENNNEPSQFIAHDINEIDIHHLRADLGITEHDVVLYAACCLRT
jgi:DNA (cytosine-5)-methyltransferase 1